MPPPTAPRAASTGRTRSYTVLADDQIMEPGPYNDIIMPGYNGAPIHIRDVGQAVRGPQNRELAAWQNGKPGVLLLVFKQPGANVIDTVERVMAPCRNSERRFRRGACKDDVDRTQTIRASVYRRRVHAVLCPSPWW